MISHLFFLTGPFFLHSTPLTPKSMAQPHSTTSLLSTTSPMGIQAASAVTPERIAALLMSEGPLAIRHITGHLSVAIPGFANLSLSKQRRLIISALETGDVENGIVFEKVGWGQWKAKSVDLKQQQHRETAFTSSFQPQQSKSLPTVPSINILNSRNSNTLPAIQNTISPSLGYMEQVPESAIESDDDDILMADDDMMFHNETHSRPESDLFEFEHDHTNTDHNNNNNNDDYMDTNYRPHSQSFGFSNSYIRSSSFSNTSKTAGFLNSTFTNNTNTNNTTNNVSTGLGESEDTPASSYLSSPSIPSIKAPKPLSIPCGASLPNYRNNRNFKGLTSPESFSLSQSLASNNSNGFSFNNRNANNNNFHDNDSNDGDVSMEQDAVYALVNLKSV